MERKNISPNLTNSQVPEQHVFGPLEPEPEPLEKNYQELEPLGEKSGARDAWKKKSGAGAAKN